MPSSSSAVFLFSFEMNMIISYFVDVSGPLVDVLLLGKVKLHRILIQQGKWNVYEDALFYLVYKWAPEGTSCNVSGLREPSSDHWWCVDICPLWSVRRRDWNSTASIDILVPFTVELVRAYVLHPCRRYCVSWTGVSITAYYVRFSRYKIYRFELRPGSMWVLPATHTNPPKMIILDKFGGFLFFEVLAFGPKKGRWGPIQADDGEPIGLDSGPAQKGFWFWFFLREQQGGLEYDNCSFVYLYIGPQLLQLDMAVWRRTTWSEPTFLT